MAGAAVAAAGPAQWVQANVTGNGLAVLTLDRPKALNAMNLDMDIIYKKYLDEWATEPTVKSVLIQSSSARAFCAGGDIKQMHNHNSDNENGIFETALKVFAAEYSLICEIANYKKPYISLMDGITMGFGIGLSGHGRYRIVTERTVLAMPENGIGLFPDVGFAHIASRSPGGGAVGAYLALTGARISNPADALYVGLASHYVPSQDLPPLKEALLQLDLSGDAYQKVEELLGMFSKTPEDEPKLKGLLATIVSCFGRNLPVSGIIEALQAEEQSEDPAVAEWAKGALEGIKKAAPLSLAVTQRHFADVAAAASDTKNPLSQIEGVMRKEYSLGTKTSMRPDFLEGVRAVLIDKDQNPRWKPEDIKHVDHLELEEVLSPLEGHPPPF
ncbi:3-hydroxyisobutyryl-CoA hydrolase [Marchantia polymorpha subsp. ruderalis]|uniref:3-hydroxyisobutyryl-CoA hydrolase n=2 Tax=Marchantia polymorpha TaxID=3197 RepID=A0AAF6BBP8_MARPO|nr:hypothetical protein MARPO_0126s0026 [Marchantia polymorpha]BBN09432.1 hypothetical protein Mp_4g19680 [Marchantia polymorpha subsp. ruderalis]|eukprot:PTQ30311.1 hypothetical protein MARPO_0126s0026 [Marchantia polymorpha]